MPESNYDNEMNAHYLKVDYKLGDEKIVGEEKIKKYPRLEELTKQFELKDSVPDKPKPLSLPHYVCREFFKLCPFCGESVNVFQIQETRYGGSNPYSWTIECKNMGCIFERPSTGDLSLRHLMERWNKRV